MPLHHLFIYLVQIIPTISMAITLASLGQRRDNREKVFDSFATCVKGIENERKKRLLMPWVAMKFLSIVDTLRIGMTHCGEFYRI